MDGESEELSGGKGGNKTVTNSVTRAQAKVQADSKKAGKTKKTSVDRERMRKEGGEIELRNLFHSFF